MHDLEIGELGSRIVFVGNEAVASENVQTLVQELAVKDESCEPEAPVLLENFLVNSRCNLNLAVHSDWQAALVEEVSRDAIVGTLAQVLHYDTILVSELIEALLVNEREPLVDQDVGVLSLVAPLVHKDLLHCWVVPILVDLRLKILVFTTKALIWDPLRVKVVHLSIVELVPLFLCRLAFFSILDE